MQVLFAHDPEASGTWRDAFARDAPGAEFLVWEEGGDYSAVDYLITWKPKPGLLQEMPNLKAIFLLSAGTDHLSLAEIPNHVSIIRMSEPGLTRGMIEYVTFAVQGIHRGLFGYAQQQRRGEWLRHRFQPAGTKRVGVMGLGALGSAVLGALQDQGFVTRGWSRTPKAIEGAETLAGMEQLEDFLGGSDILICLVPLTPQTRDLLGKEALAMLPQGAAVINVARGGIIDEQALLDALDAGHISQAVLDVFKTEPLPPQSPLWSHPKVFVTPHIASVYQPETAAAAVVRNLKRHASGERLEGAVDPERNY